MSHFRTSSQSVSVLGSTVPSTSKQQNFKTWKFPTSSKGGPVRTDYQDDHRVHFTTTTTSTSLRGDDAVEEEEEEEEEGEAKFERRPMHQTRLSIAYSTVNQQPTASLYAKLTGGYGSPRMLRAHDYVQLVVFVVSLIAFMSALTGHGHAAPLVSDSTASVQTTTTTPLTSMEVVKGFNNKDSVELQSDNSQDKKIVLVLHGDDDATESPIDVLLDPAEVPVPCVSALCSLLANLKFDKEWKLIQREIIKREQ